MYNNFSQIILKEGSFDNFTKFVTFISTTKFYSIFNAALLYCQRPGGFLFETEAGWNKKGRYLKSTASPLVILQPFAPVNFVYELEDTYGRDLGYTRDEARQTRQLSVFNDVGFGILTNFLAANNIDLSEANLGTARFGFVQPLEPPMILYTKKTRDGFKDVYGYYGIVLNSNKSVPLKFTTVMHELGHLFCGHVRPFNKAARDLIKLERYDLSDEVKETEAETVVKLVCARINVEYDNYDYLSQYKVGGKAPEICLEVVINAADKVLKIIEPALPFWIDPL